MLKKLIKRALSKTIVIEADSGRSRKQQRTSKVQTLETPASKKLLYGVYFMIMFFLELTTIQIVHVIFLGSFNNEILHLMNPLVSVIIGVFFGAKI